MTDMTAAAAEAAKNHHMWGFSLEFWNSVIVWTIAIAAVAGAISVAAGFVAGIVGYRTLVRIGIVTLGFAMAVYYFWKIYGGEIHMIWSD